jgi:sortase A
MTAVAERATELPSEPEEPQAAPYTDTRVARTLRATGISLTTLAVLILGFLVYVVWISGVQEHRDQTTMYADLRDKLAHGTAPVRPTAEGTPLAILEISRLGLREVVVEGSSASDLMHGPGHRRDTPLPGQPGISVIYGRSETYGGPFTDLLTMRYGDMVSVTTGQGISRYQVTDVGVDTIRPIPGWSYLVLDTADSHLAPGRDQFVLAKLVGQQVPGNSTYPVITRPELGASGEPSALVPLLLWSQFLLIAAVGTTWAYLRWSRWPTYVVSTPILLAGIWNVYENLARLLPNTL